MQGSCVNAAVTELVLPRPAYQTVPSSKLSNPVCLGPDLSPDTVEELTHWYLYTIAPPVSPAVFPPKVLLDMKVTPPSRYKAPPAPPDDDDDNDDRVAVLNAMLVWLMLTRVTLFAEVPAT